MKNERKNTYYYLVYLQYLGFRYHGWQKQPGVKTIELMLEKTLDCVLGHTDYKILGASRTDSKVSAEQSAFELFVGQNLEPDPFISEMNRNLPNDIRITGMTQVSESFNIIQASKIKHYRYLFAFGEKYHPFCAGLVSSFTENLDVKLMMQGAALFEGLHDFRRYCTKPSPGTQFNRRILMSQITGNQEVSAGFFPDKTYAYHVQSKGFMRNQVRLMMGQLLRLGRGEINLEEIEQSLEGKDNRPLKTIAPASGLSLYKIEFRMSNKE